MLKRISFIFLFSLLFQFCFAQLSVNAGGAKTVCINGSVLLGGSPTASGGTAPYTYTWTPTTFLNNASSANPTASGYNSSITYTVRVTDKNGNTGSDVVTLYLDPIHTFNAGIDTGYCFGQMPGVIIGATNNNNTAHNFSWLPQAGLSDPNATNPLATPSITTTYTLQVSDGICPNHITQVTVAAFMPPPVDAGNDTIIDEGNTITLNGSGGLIYWWQPYHNIKYQNTANPDVWPITTTVYTLAVEDVHRCYAYDTVRVEVVPGSKLFFYSAFTPNGDGENDFFYIGNLEKYPDNNLKIYNRYGKLIYSATNYDNTWNGTYLGNLIPTGTYFYILDDGKSKKYNGTVTILR